MRLYVGNIPYNTDENALRVHFESVGEVGDIKIVIDRDTGRSRGFAFVEIDDEGGRRALSELNDGDFGGRRIVVGAARAREARQNNARDDRRWDRAWDGTSR